MVPRGAIANLGRGCVLNRDDDHSVRGMEIPTDKPPTSAGMSPWRKEGTCPPAILLSVLGYIYWQGEGDVSRWNIPEGSHNSMSRPLNACSCRHDQFFIDLITTFQRSLWFDS